MACFLLRTGPLILTSICVCPLNFNSPYNTCVPAINNTGVAIRPVRNISPAIILLTSSTKHVNIPLQLMVYVPFFLITNSPTIHPCTSCTSTENSDCTIRLKSTTLCRDIPYACRFCVKLCSGIQDT